MGLPGAAVRESKERVRAAIKNSGFAYPQQRITINLAPADLKKDGPIYDLAIAVGLLCASGQAAQPDETSAFLGELSLDGQLRGVAGALPMAISAKEAGIKRLFIAAVNADEAAYVEGLEVYAVETLAALAAHLGGDEAIAPVVPRANQHQNTGAPRTDAAGNHLCHRPAGSIHHGAIVMPGRVAGLLDRSHLLNSNKLHVRLLECGHSRGGARPCQRFHGSES